MALPGDLQTVVVTGTFLDLSGNPLAGRVSFTPSATLTDATGLAVVFQVPVIFWLSAGVLDTGPLVSTDNTTFAQSGWTYLVTVLLEGSQPYSFSCFIPHSPSPVDLSTLAPVTVQPASYSYLPSSGGSLSGTVTLGGSPPLRLPSGAAGEVLTSDGSGNLTLQPSGDIVLPAGDLGGTASVPTVTSTHLSSALPIAQGGTAGTTAAGALTALGAAQLAAANTFTSDQYFESGRPWVDPCAYGADPTGVTACDTALASALTRAGAGGCVRFPPGVFKISSQHVLPAGITVTGAGNGATILRLAPSASVTSMLALATGQFNTSVVISGIQFDGNKASSATATHGLYLFGATDCIVDRCRFVNISGHSVTLDGSGTYLATANKILGSFVRNCGGNGLNVTQYANDTQVASCDFGSCTGKAYYLDGIQAAVTGSIGWGSSEGLVADTGSGEVWVSGCRFDQNQYYGVWVLCPNFTMTGSLVYDNSASGSGTQPGILIDAGASDTVLAGVRSVGGLNGASQQSYGLTLNSGRTGPAIVTGCDFNGNGTGTVNVVGSVSGDQVGSDPAGAAATEATRAEAAEALALAKASNLSDLASAGTARTNLGLGTAATQASSAFDGAGAAATAQAAAIAASLPTLAHATASASATLAVNTVTQVTAAAALTMTLPSPVAGALIVVERESASAANVAVSVTGNIRGVASTTLTLLLSGESEMFLGTSSTWNPVAGHKTLGSLATQFANVFSPLAYGAVGNGTTDDTAALQACITAAVAVSGVVDLGTLQFLTSSPMSIGSNTFIRGTLAGNSAGPGGAIINSVSDLFRVASSASHVTFENVSLYANGGASTGGHVWNLIGSGCSFWKIKGCFVYQHAYNYAIIYLTGDNQGLNSTFPGGWIDCLIDDECYFQASHFATVSPISMIRGLTLNSLQINDSRFVFDAVTSSLPAVPFMRIDPGFGAHHDTLTFNSGTPTVIGDVSAVAGDLGMLAYSTNFPGGSSLITAVTPGTGYTVATAATAFTTQTGCLIGKLVSLQDILIKNVTFEQGLAGDIALTSTVNATIDHCALGWDVTSPQIANIIDIRQGASGYFCANVTVRNSTTRLYPGSSFYSLYADSNTTSLVVDNFCGSWGTPPVISVPAAQTTIISPQVTSTSAAPVSSFPALAVAGAAGAVTATRYMGGTGGGHPSTGTFAAGDFIIDTTGSVWICTTGGTPGTWLQVGSAAGYASVDDPNGLGFTANYLRPGPTGANEGIVGGAAMSAQFSRLAAGGHAISHLAVLVAVSSGNVSAACYTASGSGSTSVPGGGQLATTGGIACPAVGLGTMALGSTVTPHITDWVGLSADNGTATFQNMVTTNTYPGFGTGLIGDQQLRTDTAAGGTISASATVTDASAVTGDLNKGITATRTDTLCTVTTSSATVLDTHAVATDVGGIITNTTTPANFAANTTITAVTPGTSYTVSPVAVSGAGTATQTLVISGPAFIPSNTTITAVAAGTGYTISANANATASSLNFLVGPHPLPATPSIIAGFNPVYLMRGS